MFDIMPGDLKGIGLDGEEMGLKTFGMAAIELIGSGGQKLNLASGSTASLTMPSEVVLAIRLFVKMKTIQVKLYS